MLAMLPGIAPSITRAETGAAWIGTYRKILRGAAPLLTLLVGLLFSLPLSAVAQNVTTGTVVYGTGQSATIWQGGTISAGATLRLDDGATVSSGVGNPFVSGTLQFNATTPLTISSTISGAGTLSLTNTGTLSLTGTSSSPLNPVALDMTTVVSAGLLQSGTTGLTRLSIGDTGTGSLNVNGGQVKDSVAYIGYNAGSSGTATISSGLWTNQSSLYVGSSGSGVLNVSGGQVTNNNGFIGHTASGIGTATVTSGTWALSGSLTIGNTGTGTLNVAGGNVTSNGLSIIGNNAGSSGTINVASGTFQAQALAVGNGGTGSLNITGGKVIGGAAIGYQAGSVGVATMSSGTWIGGAHVGWGGTGTLNISGGYVETTGTIGLNGGVGTVNVSNGSLWAGANVSDLTVGGSGTGTLNVTGGQVTSKNGNIGYSAGSVGIVTVTSGTWDNINFSLQTFLNVGRSGTGTLYLNGGRVTNDISYIGKNPGGVGTVTVSSGTWTNSDIGNIGLNVGDAGKGTLNINGGTVINQNASVGYSINGSGTVNVTSGTWANNGFLVVGSSGTGTLNMNGGLVSVSGGLTKLTYGTINLNSGGTLQIGTGGTTGVLLGGTGSFVDNGTLIFNRSNASTYSGSLSGSGAVIKLGGGTLTLSGSNGYTGVTSLNGGVLSLGNASALARTGTISFGGGSLQYSGSNTVDYSAKISNSGSAITIDTNGQNVTFASGVGSSNTGGLTKSGLGTLVLSGSNTFFGATTVSAGALIINGSLTSSPVTVASGGTLGGSGRIGSLVTVQSGGVLSPGNSPGALTTAALNLQAGSMTLMQIVGAGTAAGVSGNDYDQTLITTANSLTYGGDLVLSFLGSPLFDNGTMFSLFSFSGTAGGGFNTVTTAAGSSGYSGMTFQHNANGNWYTPDTSRGQYLVFDPASGQLSIVPEPSTWVMAAIASGLVALKFRRRKRTEDSAVAGA